VAALDPRETAARLRSFRHRWLDGRDVACLLFLAKQMRASHSTVEAFFAEGLAPDDPTWDPPSHPSRRGRWPSTTAGSTAAGVCRGRRRALLLSVSGGGQRLQAAHLYLRWMARRDGVDLGVWRRPDPSQLVLPLDAHTFAIACRIRLTRYRSPGWAMALDVTRRLRKLDPADPVKYDFAFHRMGLLKRTTSWIRWSEATPRGSPTGSEQPGGISPPDPLCRRPPDADAAVGEGHREVIRLAEEGEADEALVGRPQRVAPGAPVSRSHSWTAFSWQTVARKPPSARKHIEVAGRRSP